MTELDEFLDDLFFGCAAAAFVDEAILQQGWPDEVQTRLRACRYYEEELARRHRERDREAIRIAITGTTEPSEVRSS